MLVLFWNNLWSLNVQKPIFAKRQLDMCFAYFDQICQYPGWGKNVHPEYFATKLFVMTACDILRWTVKFDCTKIILSQDTVRYVFCLINSRGGVKMPSRTLCPKSICNDCLCYSEIIFEVSMYKNHYLSRYS